MDPSNAEPLEPTAEDLHSTLTMQLPSILRIMDRRLPQFHADLEGCGRYAIDFEDWSSCVKYVRQLHGVVTDGAQVDADLGPTGPMLNAESLHPVVWDAVKHRWGHGNDLDAIRRAATEVEQQLRDKVGIHDNDVTSIVGGVFKNDESGRPAVRLRFPDLQPDSNTWANAHEGAAAFGRGVSRVDVAGHAARSCP